MPENPDYEALVTQMREAASLTFTVRKDRIGLGFATAEELQLNAKTLDDAMSAMIQGADAIEALLKERDVHLDLIDKALAVFRLSSEKGMLFVTDPETRSDKLVGFFCPPDPIVALGKAAHDADDAV